MKVRDLIREDLEDFLKFGEYESYTLDMFIDYSMCRYYDYIKCEDIRDRSYDVEELIGESLFNDFSSRGYENEKLEIYYNIIDEYFKMYKMKKERLPNSTSQCIVDKIDLPFFLDVLDGKLDDFNLNAYM